MEKTFKKIFICGIMIFVSTVILSIVLSILNTDETVRNLLGIASFFAPFFMIIGLVGYMFTKHSKHSKLAKEGKLTFAKVLYSKKAVFSSNRNQMTEVGVEFELPNRLIIRGKVKEKRSFFNPKDYLEGSKILIRYNVNNPEEMQFATGVSMEEFDKLSKSNTK